MPSPAANTFDVLPGRKRIIIFKAAGGWTFKHFFDDGAIFRELADHYNKDLYSFEFKTVGERNKALKLLELRGFEVEDQGLRGQAAQIQQIRPGAEEFRGHDRDPGMAHLPDEGPGRDGGGPEAVGKAGGGRGAVLGAACRRARRKG